MIRWLLLCLLGGTGLYAQLRQPSFLQTTTDNGLPANEIYSLLQDREGMLWMGSEAGLVKHCGAYLRVIRNKEQQSPEIAGLALGKSGRVYGYNFNRQLFFAAQDSLRLLRTFSCNISSIASDSTGFLWVTTDSGMFRFTEQTATWTRMFAPAEARPAKNAMRDHRHHIWYYEDDVIAERWGEAVVRYPLAAGSPAANLPGLYFLVPGEDGNIWMLGLMNGLYYRLSGGTFRPYISACLSNLLKNRKITTARSAGNGRIWIMTHSGVIRWDPATDTGEEFFPAFAVSDVLCDREGNHWFSTLGNGIVQVPDLRSAIVRDGTGNGQGRITRLLYHEGAVYFGTQAGMLGKTDTLSGATSTWDTGLKTSFYSLKAAENGIVAATTSQVFQLRNGQLSAPAGPFPPIKDLVRAGNSYVIASSFGGYVFPGPLLPDKATRYAWPWTTQLVWQPAEGRLWAAGREGLIVSTLRKDSLFHDTTLFRGSRVMFAEAGEMEGGVYVLLAGGNLIHINKHLTINLLISISPDLQVHQMLVGGGVLYLATNRGVQMLDLKTRTWRILGTPDGLYPEDVLAIALSPGKLYVSAGDRLHAFPLRKPAKAKPLSIIHLAGVYAGGQRLSPGNFLTIRHNQIFSVEAQASAYTSLGDFQYAWRLTSGDTTWRYFPATTRRISLSGLPAGPFTLEIKAVDHTGRDSANRIVLRGRMVPPYWQQWWFYVLIGLAALAGAWLVFRQRVRALQKKQQAVIQRLELEHSLRMSQQTAIAARMNPHFIFNVLNAIKSYIYENDKKQALKYLTDFSILMREVLQMSGLPRVSLAQELRTLGLYIHLESMLCEGGVHYTLTADPSLDAEQCMIPSMLLQPVVENAFRHGLRHKEGDKHLIITVLKLTPSHSGETGAITITLEDNGIGRAASAALNQSRQSGHTSFGSSATEKRIELLTFEHPGSVGMLTEDLTAPDGTPAGTRVTFTLHSYG